MNEEVRKAVEFMDSCIQTLPDGNKRDWQTIRAELTRLTEIAESVDPLVVRLGEVTEKLERANAWNERVSVCRNHTADVIDGTCLVCRLEAANALLHSSALFLQDMHILPIGETCDASVQLLVRIQAHLSEPRT